MSLPPIEKWLAEGAPSAAHPRVPLDPRALLLGRRALLGGAAALLAAPTPVFAQATPPAAPPAAPAAGAGGQSAVITVDRARVAPIPVALPDFRGASPAEAALGHNIAGVITADLVGCGLFRAIDPASFIQTSVSATATPDFASWKDIGTQALVTGAVVAEGANIRVEFRLWDVLPGTQIQGTAYTTARGNWRRVAHIIADAVYQRLVGEKGYFDTRIVYVSRTGPLRVPVLRLAVMDQDGANNRFLTDGRWEALTPRFHPTKDEICFLSYIYNRPRVYLLDLGTAREQVVGDFSGMTFAPRFAPDGNVLIFAVTHGGGSDIYTYNLNTRHSHRLTDSGAIDVSPCYSPDGSQIVFNSDRGGDQQLYVMSADGSNVRRISYGNGRYGTPVWSPRGDLIAFTRIGSGGFAIGVMAPDGSGERILTEGFSVEGPTFCPNGRVLAFWRSTPMQNASGAGYSARLVSIDITGFNERVMVTPTFASDPAWSPLLS
ncbi:MAG: Tol-Pal system beta propeller repeat protein TolB [Acetobacteraceae bacterium]